MDFSKIHSDIKADVETARAQVEEARIALAAAQKTYDTLNNRLSHLNAAYNNLSELPEVRDQKL